VHALKQTIERCLSCHVYRAAARRPPPAARRPPPAARGAERRGAERRAGWSASGGRRRSRSRRSRLSGVARGGRARVLRTTESSRGTDGGGLSGRPVGPAGRGAVGLTCLTSAGCVSGGCEDFTQLIVRNGSHGRRGAGHARGHRLLVRHCDCPGSAGAATTRRPRHRHIGGICAAVR
jgi:hypothetical protein